jgi:hypothetical protein
VGSELFWQYGLAVKLKVAIGSGVIVIGALADTWGHPLAAAIVLVTVNEPVTEFARLITPVEELMFMNTEDALNEPATPPPTKVGTGSDPLLQ